jgi:hypothetical protein
MDDTQLSSENIPVKGCLAWFVIAMEQSILDESEWGN